ncbi:hypothetical protein BDW22DRAFT_1407481 [Trametopsis cervina]|nr:hypothetical protein BDW22DRAFT_1407481 [Trametopsis cervina]
MVSTELAKRLDDLKAGDNRSADALNDLALDVAKLRKEFIDARDYLPPYDQRQYENFLTSTEQSIEELRSSAAGKPKFVFRRKANKGKEAVITSTSNTPAESSASSHVSLSGHSDSYLSWSSLPSPTTGMTDIAISDLRHCVVNLLPQESDASKRTISALHVRNLVDTVLLLPRIDGSALIHDLTNCTIVLGCHQFRMHTSSHVHVHLHILSNPIIEHCSAIAFTGYPASLHEKPSVPESKHLSVQDFTHIRPTPSPNWSALSAEKDLSAEEWIAFAEARSDRAVAMLLHALPQGKESVTG